MVTLQASVPVDKIQSSEISGYSFGRSATAQYDAGHGAPVTRKCNRGSGFRLHARILRCPISLDPNAPPVAEVPPISRETPKGVLKLPTGSAAKVIFRGVETAADRGELGKMNCVVAREEDDRWKHELFASTIVIPSSIIWSAHVEASSTACEANFYSVHPPIARRDEWGHAHSLVARTRSNAGLASSLTGSLPLHVSSSLPVPVEEV